jgi:hypothetical protein
MLDSQGRNRPPKVGVTCESRGPCRLTLDSQTTRIAQLAVKDTCPTGSRLPAFGGGRLGSLSETRRANPSGASAAI